MNDITKEPTAPECADIPELDEPERSWPDEDEELAALARALAHPARVQIVRFLLAQGRNRCICRDICRELPLAQSTVSQHLKVLRETGIIRGRVEGPCICYCVNRHRLQRLEALLGTLQDHEPEGEA